MALGERLRRRWRRGRPTGWAGPWWAGWWGVWLALLAVLLVVGGVVAYSLDRYADLGFVPDGSDHTSRLVVEPVPVNRAGASTGSWSVDCGRNENGHRNADNLVAQPGKPHGAMHEHDYVGNVITDAFSTDEALQAADTTCAAGDRSTYYWPVLRVFGPGSGTPSPPVMENTGRILLPDSVLVSYQGSPSSAVVAMPRLLRASTGNARAVSQGGLNTGHVRWGCSGQPGRSTLRYPECPTGQRIVRTADYPSCWDGRRTDSPTHRAHLVFPDAAGTCPADTFAVPRLHLQLTYTVPTGLPFAIDTMPAERRAALTDHFDHISILPDQTMQQLVSCINTGRTCSAR